MHGDGFVKRVDRHNIQDRRESLVADQRSLAWHADNGRLHEVCAQIWQPAATSQDFPALRLRQFDCAQHGFDSALMNQRTHQHVGLHGIAHAHRPISPRESLAKLGGDTLLNDQAAGAGAALSSRADCAEDDSACRQVQIGIVAHDDGIVAAQFQYAAPQPPRDAPSHLPAHRGRTREADQGQARVIDQTFADALVPADDQIEDACTVVSRHHAVANMLDGDGCQWCSRRRFPDHGIAANRRDRRIPRPYRQREVEGRDDADCAQRMPLLNHAMTGALAVHGQTIELARQAHSEIADVDHLLDFAQAFAADFAIFQRNQLAQRLFVSPQFIAQLADDFAAFGCRPHAPAAKSRHSFGNDSLIIGAGRLGNCPDRRVGGGIQRNQLLAAAPPAICPCAGARVGRCDAQRVQYIVHSRFHFWSLFVDECTSRWRIF